MNQLKNYYKEMGVEEKVFDYAQEVEKGLKDGSAQRSNHRFNAN